MTEHGWTIFLVIVVVVLLLVYWMAFTVKFNEIAIVKTFGRAGPPIDGATDAGLHWKWPWPIQSLVRYDGRIFIFDDTHDQVQTKDKQNLLVTVYCGWRVRDANLFLRSIATVEKAEDRLRSIVRSVKADVVGQHVMAHFVNTDPEKMLIAEVEDEMRASVAEVARKDYGVEIATLGIKSLGLPKTVTEKVIENMKEERNREAELYKGRGQAIANEIRSRAEAARDQILEFARAKAKNIRAEGVRAAAEFYEKFRRNEPFAMFLRELDFLRDTLKENSVFLLDPSVQHGIDFFKNGPSLPPAGQSSTTQPAGSPPAGETTQ